MPDVPKPDLDKIRQAHRRLRRQRDMNRHEWFHRAAVAVLVLVGFFGMVFLRHLAFVFCIAVIYFIVAVWRGNITFAGRGMRRGEKPPYDEE